MDISTILANDPELKNEIINIYTDKVNFRFHKEERFEKPQPPAFVNIETEFNEEPAALVRIHEDVEPKALVDIATARPPEKALVWIAEDIEPKALVDIAKEFNDLRKLYVFVRPMLIVQENNDFDLPLSKTLKGKMSGKPNPYERIQSAIRASAQIKDGTVNGTGWVVDKDKRIMVTCNHVFGDMNDEDIKKIPVDFHPKASPNNSERFKIKKILYRWEDKDLIFFQVDTSNNNFPDPIALYTLNTVKIDMDVCTIGYPGFISDISDFDEELINELFKVNNVPQYGVKRVSPGKTMKDGDKHETEDNSYHDCSVTGGTSGSPIFSYDSNKVVGIHQGGKHTMGQQIGRNIAIKSYLILQGLEKARQAV